MYGLLKGDEKYIKITIYSDFVNKNTDYAVIDYEKSGVEGILQKEIPSWEIKNALAEFALQKKKKVKYGKEVEVININKINKEGRRK